MDPATFQLLMAALTVGSQAMTLWVQNREALTADQAAQAEVLIARITAAQALVTPYVKEK